MISFICFILEKNTARILGIPSRGTFTINYIIEAIVNKTLEYIEDGEMNPDTIKTAMMCEIEHIKLLYKEVEVEF